MLHLLFKLQPSLQPVSRDLTAISTDEMMMRRGQVCYKNFANINPYTVRVRQYKKTSPNNYHDFRFRSIFFLKIFRDYSQHNLPLLLQILSHQLSLFRSSTVLNIKD